MKILPSSGTKFKKHRKVQKLSKAEPSSSVLRNGLHAFASQPGLMIYPIGRAICLTLTATVVALLAAFPFIHALTQILSRGFSEEDILISMMDYVPLPASGWVAWGALLFCGLMLYLSTKTIFDAGLIGRISEKFRKTPISSHPVVHFFVPLFGIHLLFAMLFIAVAALFSGSMAMLFYAWGSLPGLIAVPGTAFVMTLGIGSGFLLRMWHKSSAAALVTQDTRSVGAALLHGIHAVRVSPGMTLGILIFSGLLTLLIDTAADLGSMSIEQLSDDGSGLSFVWMLIYIIILALAAILDAALWSSNAAENAIKSVSSQKLFKYKRKTMNIHDLSAHKRAHQAEEKVAAPSSMDSTPEQEHRPLSFSAIKDEVFGELPYKFEVNPANILKVSEMLKNNPVTEQTNETNSENNASSPDNPTVDNFNGQ